MKTSVAKCDFLDGDWGDSQSRSERTRVTVRWGRRAIFGSMAPVVRPPLPPFDSHRADRRVDKALGGEVFAVSRLWIERTAMWRGCGLSDQTPGETGPISEIRVGCCAPGTDGERS